MGMHTGYVHPVADGKITDLKSFALMCARAMGACVMQRDDPRDAPPPREVKPDLDYYTERLAQAQARLDALTSMTAPEIEAACEKHYADLAARELDYAKEEQVEYDRIAAMHEKVVAWEGAPEGLKEFMLEQLSQSLGRPPIAGLSPNRKPARVWYEDEFTSAAEAVGRASGAIAREKALAASRTAWLKQLWASVE